MRRTKVIKVRVSPEEHQRLKAMAGKEGVGAFLRTKGLGDAARSQLHLLAEVCRARNLLSQIAQNSVRWPALDQLLIVSQLVNVERELSKLLLT